MTAVLRDLKTSSHIEKLSEDRKRISHKTTKKVTFYKLLRISIMLYLLLGVAVLSKDHYRNRDQLAALTKLLDSVYLKSLQICPALRNGPFTFPQECNFALAQMIANGCFCLKSKV